MNKIIIVVVAVIVIGMSIAVYASGAKKGTTKFNEYKKNDESSYELNLNIEKVPNDYFKGQITEVKDMVLKQIEEYEPYMSWYPLHYSRMFDSVDLALEYMGTGIIEHPLGDEGEVMLKVECNDSGEFKCVSLESEYEFDEYKLQIFNYIFTERYNADKEFVRMSSHALGDIDYTYSTGTLASGVEADIITSSPNEGGVVNVSAYFVKGEVVYSINIPEKDGNTDKALEVMNKVLKLY